MSMSEREKQEALTVAKRCDVWDTAASDALEMFLGEGNDYQPGGRTFATWLGGQRERRGYLFVSKAAVDLETLAFGSGNVTARGSLVKEIGLAAANERANAWGLRDANDYRPGVAVAPNTETDASGKPKKPDEGNNPFSAAAWNVTEQGRIHRGNPQLAENLAKSAGVKIGATKPKV